MCAELSDIPTGPCLGFYVIPGANDDEEEDAEKHEFVHAPLLKSCHDDDDDDDKEEKGYNSTTDDEVPKLKPQRQPLRRHHHHNHSVLGGGSKWKKIDGNFDYTAIRQAIETNRMFALTKGGKSKAKFSHKVLPQTSSSSVSGDFDEDDYIVVIIMQTKLTMMLMMMMMMMIVTLSFLCEEVDTSESCWGKNCPIVFVLPDF